MGPAEGGDYNLLHQTDPGGAAIPAREPDRPPRHQGARKHVNRDRFTTQSVIQSHLAPLWCGNGMIGNR